jgi:hypothetical protein
MANGGLFSDPAHPFGYALAIRVLRPGGDLGILTGAQHLAGLGTGVLVYVLLLRLAGRRSLAVIGAGVVVLDGYAIAIEQYVMAEAFFGFLLFASAALVALARRRATLFAGGLLLAIACTVRPVGVFCIPIWLGYVLWRHRRPSTVAICSIAVLLPLAGYAAANHAKTGHFALTDDSAWLLYGRIGEISDCEGLGMIPPAERMLCPHGAARGQRADYYIYGPNSPAVRAFGRPATRAPHRVDHLLRDFALRVMSRRPLRYAGLVGRDFLHFFVPGARSDSALEDGPITLPKPGPWLWPWYRPRQRSPAAALRAYVSVVHTVRPLLALFLLAGIVALVRPWAARLRTVGRTRPEIALLAGMGVTLLLGAVLSHFELRYVLPAVPLLASGGLLAAASLWEEFNPQLPRRRQHRSE